MKKILLFAAVAATAIAAGCSEQNAGPQFEQNQAGAIDFRGVVDKATRATTVGATTELTNFFVHAGNHATATALAGLDFMTAPVYKQGASWTYAPTKYYPSGGDEVNFYAYAPVKDVNMTTDVALAGTAAQFGYTVPADQSVDNTAVDLLVASVVNKTDDGANVVFTFDHALSAVTFSAANREATTSELTYIISDIRITKMDNVGTFDYPFSATSWTPATTRSSSYIAGVPETGVALEAVGTTADAQKLLSANDVMMVLPQTVTVGTLDADNVPVIDETFVEVTYSLKDGAGTPIFADAVRQLTLPAGFEFEAGQLYNFEFEFGGTSGAGVNAITFTVTAVNAWDTTGNTVEIPE